MTESSTESIGAHRTAMPNRSGDTCVITDGGDLVNVDQQAREAAAAEAAKAEKKAAGKAAPKIEAGAASAD